ncbi:hypothetical protein M948_07025 [Virgibacillus sp. CM-4]|uniref:MerR family transcriptional regulator n=1 Tax=Virgibacillus sp. CM-4 TaxID=1354277 RepID=UPI00038882EF|nr:MerR family transcriptional regulator [Virgibacillus sp. CM-4]EQB38326.1 hypothetical protein M948_07025 [Virgibacillus sp. CM-4]
MQIKEVARQLNTTTRTIRFYEEKGLIHPIKQENEYRIFTEEDLVRISTILALREIGITINEIKQLLNDGSRSINSYLNIQRSALFEKWLELKDMIATIDQMLERSNDGQTEMSEILELSEHLKNLNSIRKSWEDKWNFDSQAVDYDQNLKMHGYHFNVHQDYTRALKRVVETIQLKKGDTCLDIGIGTGNLGSKFIAHGVNVIGIDQSKNMLHECKKKHPEIDTRNGHFLALPVMDHQIDGIVSSYALHHIEDEQKLMAFEEMDRVLKPEGEICMVDLMFQNKSHRKAVIDHFTNTGNKVAVYSIEDEYYADRSVLIDWFKTNDYQVETYTFNPILSMIYAKKQIEGGSNC